MAFLNPGIKTMFDSVLCWFILMTSFMSIDINRMGNQFIILGIKSDGDTAHKDI